MQPASKAGSDKPASSGDSNGAAKDVKSEGAGKVRPYQDFPHSLCQGICGALSRPSNDKAFCLHKA